MFVKATTRIFSLSMLLGMAGLCSAQLAVAITVGGETLAVLPVPRLLVLVIPEVQHELKIDKKVGIEVRKLLDEWQSTSLAQFSPKASRSFSIQELQSGLPIKVRESAVVVESKIRTLIGEEAFLRYREVARQIDGPSLLPDEELDFNEEQRKVLSEMRSEYINRLQKLGPELERPMGQHRGLEVVMFGSADILKLQQKYQAMMLARLDKVQKTRWTEMLGRTLS